VSHALNTTTTDDNFLVYSADQSKDLSSQPSSAGRHYCYGPTIQMIGGSKTGPFDNLPLGSTVDVQLASDNCKSSSEQALRDDTSEVLIPR